MKRFMLLLGALLVIGGSVKAQDTLPIDRGVRIGITYTPGLRPGLLVLGGPHDGLLDSVRAILQRDLDYSDRFELITLPGGDSLTVGLESRAPQAGTAPSGSAGGPFVNYPLYAALGADLAVNIARAVNVTGITVYDVKGETIKRQLTVSAASISDPDFRMQVHRAADE